MRASNESQVEAGISYNIRYNRSNLRRDKIYYVNSEVVDYQGFSRSGPPPDDKEIYPLNLRLFAWFPPAFMEGAAPINISCLIGPWGPYQSTVKEAVSRVTGYRGSVGNPN